MRSGLAIEISPLEIVFAIKEEITEPDSGGTKSGIGEWGFSEKMGTDPVITLYIFHT
ncbi:MAG: hypothetical protein GTN70_09510 [Deltaproteobacteria bacterium]|nr:hypothetical protein [Deltaproteobacteria bacterium]NIS78013.1 hypothetical protein [Deltaproteobacteria bacterium]